MSAQLALNFGGRRSGPRYWPTTPLTADELRGAIHLAVMQDEAVLAIFRSHAGTSLTPSEVHRIGEALGRKWLVTSVRRSITNLTDDGVLNRHNVLRMGPHGKPEHLWQLATKAAA